MTVTASEVILKAVDIIEEGGLNQNGEFIGPNGSRCALGALDYASGVLGVDTDLRKSAIDSVYAALAVHRNKAVVSLTRWNDDPATTQDDVIALFRRAAENVP